MRPTKNLIRPSTFARLSATTYRKFIVTGKCHLVRRSDITRRGSLFFKPNASINRFIKSKYEFIHSRLGAYWMFLTSRSIACVLRLTLLYNSVRPELVEGLGLSISFVYGSTGSPRTKYLTHAPFILRPFDRLTAEDKRFSPSGPIAPSPSSLPASVLPSFSDSSP